MEKSILTGLRHRTIRRSVRVVRTSSKILPLLFIIIIILPLYYLLNTLSLFSLLSFYLYLSMFIFMQLCVRVCMSLSII